MKSSDTHNHDSLPDSPGKFIGAAQIRGVRSSVGSAIRELVQIGSKKADSNGERDDEHVPHVRCVRKNGPIFSANNPHIVAYDVELMLRCVEKRKSRRASSARPSLAFSLREGRSLRAKCAVSSDPRASCRSMRRRASAA